MRIHGVIEEAETMKRSILASSFVMLGLSASTTGCSRAAVICDIICTCEHCNDQEEVESCNEAAMAEDIADAYECGAKWEAYTVRRRTWNVRRDRG